MVTSNVMSDYDQLLYHTPQLLLHATVKDAPVRMYKYSIGNYTEVRLGYPIRQNAFLITFCRGSNIRVFLVQLFYVLCFVEQLTLN